jgi:hypothetical protein
MIDRQRPATAKTPVPTVEPPSRTVSNGATNAPADHPLTPVNRAPRRSVSQTVPSGKTDVRRGC